MSKRFFISEPIREGDPSVLKLSEQESHHLIHVMRAKLSDEVVLFDGEGVEFDARVQKLEKRAAWLEVLARREVNREPTVRLTLGVALPKGDRQQWLCEKLVELGCYQLTPLHTQRGVAEAGEAALARLRRFVIEASKQCGRNRLMKIGNPCSIVDFLSDCTAPPVRWFLDASGEPLAFGDDLNSTTQCRVAIGPEGGWAEQELAIATKNGWRIVSLGSRILRVETAAVAACSRICLD